MGRRSRRASRGVSPRMLWTAVVIVTAAGLVIGAWFALRGRMPAAEITFADLPEGSTFGLAAVLPGSFSEPLAITAADGRLWVAEAGASAIRQLGPQGQQLSTVTVEPAGSTPAYPSDVAALGDQLVVIDQAGDGRVVTMRNDGSDVRPFGPGFGKPTAVAADANGFYVADATSGLVSLLDASGTQEKTFGEGVTPRLGFVGGMAVDTTRLWAADSNARRVVPITLSTGKSGAKLGSAWGLPRGVALDEFGRVYVADQFAGVVRVFGAKGASLGEIGGKGTAGLDSGAKLSAPTDCAWLDGRLYVTDRQAGVVKVYNVRQP